MRLSPLSSVRFATSGMTPLWLSPFGPPSQDHWITGSKLSGGAVSMQGPIASMPSSAAHDDPSPTSSFGVPPPTSKTGLPVSLVPPVSLLLVDELASADVEPAVVVDVPAP